MRRIVAATGRLAPLLCGALLAFGAASASSANLISNGDFSLTYDPVGFNPAAPTSWTNISGNTDNAQVVSGAMLFSTMGVHNATTHRYYIYQSFDAGSGGAFKLSFDYLLRNPYNGTYINGAKVAVDNWYTTEGTVFSAKYGVELANAVANGVNYNQDNWHVGQSLDLNLTAGMHTLYIGTLGASSQNDRAAVLYDNVSITAVSGAGAPIVSSVPEPESYAMLATGLGLVGWMVRRRRARHV